jgi:signal transduction histidine kinase
VRPAERRESRAGASAKTRSLQVRLALLVVFIASPVLILVGFLSLYAADRALEHEREDRGVRIAQWLDDAFAPISLLDPPALRSEIDRFTHVRSGVSDIYILKWDEDTGDLSSVAASARVAAVAPLWNDWEALREDKPILRKQEGGWNMAAPLHDARHAIRGIVHAEVQLREKPEELLADARLYIVLAALGGLGLTGLALVFGLDRVIGEPVERLVAAMERARLGDLNVEVEVTHLDEFGWLGENFNRMLRKLKENDESLRKLMEQVARFNEELRKQVALATEELAGKNDELARANHRLFEAQRALGNSERLASLGQLASQIAHEIGTPLNSIYGHIQLLAADEIPDTAKSRVTIVEGQVERLTKIIENVLRTLRLPDAQLSEIDVNQVIAGIAAFTQPVAENRKIHLVLKLKEELPRVYADSQKLEQVLLNLFTNALDAMPSGGTLTLESDLALAPARPRDPQGSSPGLESTRFDEAHVLIRVRDTGGGIAPENLIRIFEPFFTTKAPGSGTGLGLSICQEIVSRFRGLLSAESEGLGKGSCFVVSLPAVRRTATPTPTPAEPEPARTVTSDSSVTLDSPSDSHEVS